MPRPYDKRLTFAILKLHESRGFFAIVPWKILAFSCSFI